MRRLDGPGADFIERQPACRSEHPSYFIEKRYLILDVHCSVLRPSDVKRVAIEWKIQYVALMKGDTVGQTNPLGQHIGGPTVVFDEIDSGYHASELGRKSSRRPSNAAAQIEHGEALP